ncbi:hypothetical protein [Bordetella sp. LUAb4]|uniref:hypothetical protein n=1 Tax=Bordetella sp. LUAb4 TaxID=2843195 RepID=UPI001E2F4CD3|nr:hypothetical protein [Bordetella sp. LUAb4]
MLDWGHAERRASVAGTSLASSPGASSDQADECLGVNEASDADERLELLMSTTALPDLRDEVMVYFDMLAEDTASKPADLQNFDVPAPVVESSPRTDSPPQNAISLPQDTISPPQNTIDLPQNTISPPQNSNAHRSLSDLLENPQLSNMVARKLGKKTMRILEAMEGHPDLSVDSLCANSAAKGAFSPHEIKLKRRAALIFLDRFRDDVRAKPVGPDPSRDTSGYRAFWHRWESILSGPDQEPLTILRQRPEFGEYWVEKFRLLHAQPDRPLATMSRFIFRPGDPFLRLSDDQRCELIERMQAQALEVAVEVLGTAEQIRVIMRAAESALRAKAAAEVAAETEAAAASTEGTSEAPPRRKYQRLAPAPKPRTRQAP